METLIVLLSTLGGSLLGGGSVIAVSYVLHRRRSAMLDIYYSRPLHDYRSFEQWRKDQKAGRS